jgi:hypothetical protein
MVKKEGDVKLGTWEATRDPRIKYRYGSYYARFTCRGQRIQRDLETNNFQIAVQRVDKIQGDALLGIDRATSRLFADVWPKFIKDKEIGVYSRPASERTLREYVEFGQPSKHQNYDTGFAFVLPIAHQLDMVDQYAKFCKKMIYMTICETETVSPANIWR